MKNLAELYQEIILDHYRLPRNSLILEPFEWSAKGSNPRCGDEVVLYSRRSGNGNQLRVSHQSQACAIATASASILTELLNEVGVIEGKRLIEEVISWLDGERKLPEIVEKCYPNLSGVRYFPSRIDCFKLPWTAALELLLKQQG